MSAKGMNRWAFALLLAMVVGALSASLVSADEWAADFYGGAAIPHDRDLDDGELTVGGRFGRYFTLPMPAALGVFVDASSSEFDNDLGEHLFIPVTLLPILRFHVLTSEDFPSGRLQPYIGVGPSVVFSEADVNRSDDHEIDIGVDGRTGIAFVLGANVSLFSEYRFTYSDPDFESFVVDGRRVEFNAESSVHHALFGFGFRF